MRRDQLLKAINNVTSAIRDSQIRRLIQRQISQDSDRNSKENETSQEVLESFKKFALASASFGAEEHKVLEVFELTDILDVSFWTMLTSRTTASTLYATYSAVGSLLEYSRGITELLHRDDDYKTKPQLADGIGSTRILVSDNDGISVQQVALCLRSLDELYNNVCIISQISSDKLRLGSIDSGSTKVFDIFGAAKAIDMLSGFMLETWDRIRYASSLKATATFRASVEGLTAIEKLGELVKNGALSPEEGERIRRSMVREVNQLIGAGAYTEDMTASSAQAVQVGVEKHALLTYAPETTAVVSPPRPRKPKKKTAKTSDGK